MTRQLSLRPVPGGRVPRTAMVMAAGLGKRMRSKLPKVLHPLVGQPLIGHVLRALAPLVPART